MPSRRPSWVAVLATVLGLCGSVACSTLAEAPAPRECTDDSECPQGSVCDELLRVCRDATNDPPVAYLGFDIQEQAGLGSTQFRAEVTGCDVEMDIDTTGIRAISVDRGQVSQTFRLRVFSREPIDSAMPEVTELLPATFELSQPNRLHRSPIPLRRSVAHPTLEGEDTQVVVDTTLRWPRYHPDDTLPRAYGPTGFILWTVTPESEEGVTAAASRYQMLQPPIPGIDPDRTCVADDIECCPEDDPECTGEDVPNACVPSLGVCREVVNPLIEYNFIYDANCDRLLEGTVIRVDDDLQPLSSVGGASVRLRHADVPNEPPMSLAALDVVAPEDRPPQCSSTDDCVAGEQLCNEQTRQCELALAGRTAGRATTVADGSFGARVFTYCGDQPNVGLDRAFNLTVTPPSTEPLPSMSYTVTATFGPSINPGQNPVTRLDRDLCVPDWGPPVPLSVVPTGDPVPLLPGYTCCDVSCLPLDREQAQMGAPTPPSRCSGRSGTSAPSVRASAALTLDLDLLQLWLAEDSTCVPPLAADDGTVGTLTRDASCGEDGQCLLEALAGTAAGEPRTYQLRIESPPGSMLGSLDTTVDISPPGVLDPVELPVRRRVRGFVELPESICRPENEDDGDCGSTGATVLAERLRMPGETTANTPGPYFHELPTVYDPQADRDGAYVMPLDPGVWVLTALPDTGTQGGPADMVILDLREGSDEIRQDFALEPGILVTFDVESFDRHTQVAPLDVGSWRLAGLEHPGRADLPELEDRLLDLNAPEECLAAPGESGGPPGCRVRKLVPGSTLSLTQIGTVRFTARDIGGTAFRDCTEPL